MFWPNPKDPDVSDRYGITVDDTEWLQGEAIINAIFIPTVESELVVSERIIEGNQVSYLFTGGVEGMHSIDIRIETPTRQREYCAVLWVKQAC